MTSHPKDCSHELLDAMAECEKVERHLHLPVQSGNDRVLKAMNRHYDRARYLSLIQYARSVMPDLSITSDIIVGFPGETHEEFEDTISLVGKSAILLCIPLFILHGSALRLQRFRTRSAGRRSRSGLRNSRLPRRRRPLHAQRA